MGGGQTKVYTPGSGDDESLPSKDANETPLIRLVNLAHYLDHHVPADNVKCREALAEIMDVIKTYRDGMGLEGSSDVLSAIRGNKDFEEQQRTTHIHARMNIIYYTCYGTSFLTFLVSSYYSFHYFFIRLGGSMMRTRRRRSKTLCLSFCL